MIAHRVGRFDSEDIIATRRELGGIAVEACADVEDRLAKHREHVEKRRVDFFEGERFVLLDQREAVLVVVGNGCHQARSSRIAVVVL